MPPVARDEAQIEIAREMYRYITTKDPDHMLVIKAPPGVGKTHLAIAMLADPLLARKRILFAGPRRDFYESDIIPMTIKTGQNPANWYPWQPRQLEDEAKGRCQTCAHAPHIQIWNSRGHESIAFCSRICGDHYLHNECDYYLQERIKKRWIYGAPEHVFMGHLLKFHLVIGDESPIRAALRKWLIPAHAVIPGGYDPYNRSPSHEMLAVLQNLIVSYPDILQGKALLDALGGADLVKESADSFPIGQKAHAPEIRFPEESAEAPYAHVPHLMLLLKREAEEVLKGNDDYLSRVIVENGKLLLLLRRSPESDMPKHMIWLDATANERIYKEIFGREVKIVAPRIAREGEIYQVIDGPSSKTSMVTLDGEFTVNVEKVKALLAHIVKEQGYKTVGVITFAAIEAEFQKEGYQTMHFGAETGSNQFEGIDVLFVVGTPMPPQHDIEGMTKIIYFNRMRPFQKRRAEDDKLWSKEEKHYEGHFTKQGQVGGYGGDLDLQSVLWQHREAKIIQAVHRARINLFPIDVWLLSKIPIKELPPDHIRTITEIWGGPRRGIEAQRWLAFKEFADKRLEEGEVITSADVVSALGVTAATARKWITLLVEQEPDSWSWPPADYIVPKQGRGKPPLRLVPKLITGPGEY